MPAAVTTEQILAFRLARSGLAERAGRTLVEAAACPAPDPVRDAALLALAARSDHVTRDDYMQAVHAGEVVVAYAMRGAIQAIAPNDFALYGRALIGRDDAELGAQLGRKVQKLAAAKGFALTGALEEVTAATTDALANGRRLDKNDLHQALRERVSSDLMPWCPGCQSHHVSPLLWRLATVKAGARLDSERRYLIGKPGRTPKAEEAAHRFLRFYGPATPAGFADWAGLAKSHAQRIWNKVEGLVPLRLGAHDAWILAEDAEAVESPPDATGVRLLPASDPYLQKPNRALLAPAAELHKRLFRPLASPGVVLKDGRVVALWRAKANGGKLELTVEKLGRFKRSDVEAEAQRVAQLRGAADAVLVLGSGDASG